MGFRNLNIYDEVAEPQRYPEGIKCVFVNGIAVEKKGKHTVAKPGRVLKRMV